MAVCRQYRMAPCKLWTGRLTPKGYGIVGHTLVHRRTWEEAFGPIPDGMHILHDCDVRNCIELTHLFLGTQVDNNKDRDRKNRQAKGSVHGQSKLSETQVIKIRALKEQGKTQRWIANSFHISEAQVSHIITKRNWGHL